MIFRLQRIQRFAVQVILRIQNQLPTHLRSLHWLPVKVRSTYKIACLCYHCHRSIAPSYATDMLPKRPSHSHNIRSSSQIMSHLNRHAQSEATLADCSFSLLLLSGTISKMAIWCASSHSLSKFRLKTCCLSLSLYICAWFGHFIDFLSAL